MQLQGSVLNCDKLQASTGGRRKGGGCGDGGRGYQVARGWAYTEIQTLQDQLDNAQALIRK